MSETPAALQLRLLQTVVEVAAEKTTTLIMPLPVELLRFFDRMGRDTAPAGKSATATTSQEEAIREAPADGGSAREVSAQEEAAREVPAREEAAPLESAEREEPAQLPPLDDVRAVMPPSPPRAASTEAAFQETVSSEAASPGAEVRSETDA
jgi:hypothetical protein